MCLVLTGMLFLFVMGIRTWLQSSRKARRAQDGRPAVAFFHPYCNAGGGGERVLWCAIRALQNRWCIYWIKQLQSEKLSGIVQPV